jgi:hypothetical protein
MKPPPELARTRDGERACIALGFRPVTWAGWGFWLRYWSPPAIWWLRLVRGEWWR